MMRFKKHNTTVRVTAKVFKHGLLNCCSHHTMWLKTILEKWFVHFQT